MAGLQIILNAGEASPSELDALAALLAVLRGETAAPLPLFETPAVPVGAVALPNPPTPVAAAVPPPPAVLPVAGEDSTSSDSSEVVAAPLPPVPSVPAAPAAPPPASNIADADSSGMPWDARIHSTPPTKKADGNWRRRRGVDDGTVATVEAELRGAAPAPVSVPLPPPPVAAAPPPPPPPSVPTPPVSPAPAATVPPPANVVASASANPFLDLIRFIQEGEKAGRLTHEQVAAMREQFRASLADGPAKDSLANMQGFMPNGAAHEHVDTFRQLLAATFGG